MAWDVIVDAEKEIAALIEPTVGRALGPIAMGKDGAKLIETFANAVAGEHGIDPATHPPHKLEMLWEEFWKALQDKEDLAAGAEAEKSPVEASPTGDVTPGPDTAAPPEDAKTAATAIAHAEQVIPTPIHEAAAPADADVAEETPVRNSKAGNTVCPTCDGWRTIAGPNGEQKCPTCDGAGEILGVQPEPGDKPAA